MSVGDAATGQAHASAFVEAVNERRGQVYAYLHNWPGAADFKPQDIHEGIYSYITRKGKALRPIVLLLSCGAVGGDETMALPAAGAVEVFHTWTLVHDDIIDRDDTRRGSPTVHAQYARHAREVHGLDAETSDHYGRAVAILTGDLQQSWAYALLAELRERGVDAGVVLDIVSRMAKWLTPSLLEGEMLDVQYSLMSFTELSETAVLNMLTKKTGALLEYAAWCGARIGLGRQPDTHGWAQSLGEFASLCGTAFQLHDDLLGLTADERALGKPVGSDIREGKRTLIVYRALAAASDAQRAVALRALGNPVATSSEVASTLQVLQETGAIESVRDLANQYISQAHERLEAIPPSPYRDLLASWADFLLARSY